MTKQLFAVIAVLAMLPSAWAQYPDWRHSGSLSILTTADGADLPADAVEANFPLLVRLDKGWFDFTQAKPAGQDLRFATAAAASAPAAPLAYQIEQWDAVAGVASVWVRIPTIHGNARQQINMFWGNPAVQSESSGKAVFNDAGGYLAVWHMDDPIAEETGHLQSKDLGTTPAPGMIGNARHFSPGKGIRGGENITTFPTGASSHSTEFWFRAEARTDRLLCWGNDTLHAMVQLVMGKPPTIFADLYHGPAAVRGTAPVAMNQWVHVTHTYDKGESRLYVNGRPDGAAISKTEPLQMKSPVQIDLGGWKRFGFTGDMDEVRVSSVARSANWIKLQYENQKPLQTAVGPLVQPGDAFAVSPPRVELREGQRITLTAQAGGAEKIYWIRIANGQEQIVAVDRLAYTLEAGRVSGDKALALRFKAIYPAGPKIVDIPVTIREDIPEPAFRLSAPAKWDGRQTIEIVPQVTNLGAMKAKGAGDFKTNWSASGLAILKEIAPGKLILKRAQNSGTLTITASIDNGGQPTTQSVQVAITEPAKDAWVQRTPDKDEKPTDNQFYARDDSNAGTLYFNGTLDAPADAVFVRLYANDKLIDTQKQPPGADQSYAFTLKLKPGLIKYKVEFGTITAGAETIRYTASNLVCGDVYIIQGQSNAVAYNYRNEQHRPDLTRPDYASAAGWVRTYGGNGEAENPSKGGWGVGVIEHLPNAPDRVHYIGAWGAVMARKIVLDQKMPVCILNGAFGGTRLDQHLPDPADPLNTADKKRSIYRNLLRRATEARLTHGVRGVIWHQGEADQGFDGPDNCYGVETYQQYFIDLTAAWKRDFPNLQNYYVWQIYPNACGQGGRVQSDRLRDLQRRLPSLYSHMSVLPTLGFVGGRGCHFPLEDYERMGLAMAPLLERDANGQRFEQPITAPDLKRAYYSSYKQDEITLEFDQPVVWDDNALATLFHLDAQRNLIGSGKASGNLLKLKLTAPQNGANAKTITYITDKTWDGKASLKGANGMAALTFCEVAVDAARAARP